MSEPKSRQLGSNASYCVVFLWNAGEKLRSIGLARELLLCETLMEAKAYVEKLVATYGDKKRKAAQKDRKLREKLQRENPCYPPV